MNSIINKIINFNASDFHMHTSSFSDWLNTFDEMITFAWRIWLKEIVITDHSDACKEFFEKQWFYSMAARYSLRTYKNVLNNVKVSFGVEWDIINKEWNCIFTIQWKDSDFCILSAHPEAYDDPLNTITEATINAIEKYHKKIKFIWHPVCDAQFWKYYNIEKLVEVANNYDIPLEINAKSIAKKKTNEEKLKIMLEKWNKFYFNSDAHNLADMQEYRKDAAKYLLSRNYISQNEYEKFINLFSFI